MAQRIEISYKTIVFTVSFLLSLWILYQVQDVIFLLVVSFVVMSGLRPLVDQFERIKIPRPFAILIVYILLFSLIGIIFYLVIPPLVSQSQRLFGKIGSYFSVILPFIDLSPQKISGQIPLLSANVLKLTTGVFSTVIGFFTFIVFTFYLLLERRHLKNFLVHFVGSQAEEKITATVRRVESRLGGWLIGQITLMIIIGLATYTGLQLLGVEFALSLAIIAGILEIVPILGPIISAVPAVLVALTVSPVLAIAVVSLYFIIQQIENNIVVPLVMRRAVGLPPLVTITALMIGGKLAGLVGIVLSVPILVASQVIIQDIIPGKFNRQGNL